MLNLTSNLASLGQSSMRMALGLLLALLYTRGASAQTSTTPASTPETSTPLTGGNETTATTTPTTTTNFTATTTTSRDLNFTTTTDYNNTTTNENDTTTEFVDYWNTTEFIYPTILGNTTLLTEVENSTLEEGGWWTMEETTASTPTPEPPIDRSGPLKCFYKPAAHSGKPRLETCGVAEDACLIAYMRHQDGQLYTRQKCINTEMEAPFYADIKELEEEHSKRKSRSGRKRASGRRREEQGGACRDWPLDGTYLCACEYSGCNWEKNSAGYIPPLHRLFPPLVLLVILACLTCCCCICCGGQQKKGVVHSR